MKAATAVTGYPHSHVIGMTSSASLAAAVSGAGGLGIVDLGDGRRTAGEAIAAAVDMTPAAGLGIRVPAGCAMTWDDVVLLLGDATRQIETIVLGAGSPWRVDQVPDRHLVLVEVTTREEAELARRWGADGVVARGNEAGGRVSDTGSFVLLQHLLTEQQAPLPIWLCGGIGPHTAAAAIAGGAAGVVLDTQLALLDESDLADDARTAIAASDGTDTEVVDGVRTLRGTTLTIGQDAFLATRIAARFGTVARAIGAVRAAIDDAMRAGYEPPLVRGSTLAAALGTDLPVVQGPMTRVSDCAAFAAAVADEGALPFLALALASGEQARRMLADAAEELGDRPWGVGVLGFAPEDVRAAQLTAIREARPHTALIAGGRPDQARALEDEGIATFLHVPSPGLLEQYLHAGTRRFVFEGAECGGHVGPRSSFTLWEAQLGVLLEHIETAGTGGDLQVLFAGGIHDARSSAMVSALAEPLVSAGAAVGVLMGTGYLFTEEAVEHGAVLPAFQQRLIAARRTALLETAPGHATRCVTSPFTEHFATAAASLAARGTDPREAWARLEQLNVGRLRIASKGLRRDGARLVAVDEPDQVELGLYMAGQVATLRERVTTIAELHSSVTDGAAAHYAARAEQVRAENARGRARTAPAPLDIAIVGMSCVYPGAADLTQFWAGIVGNADAVTEVPAERWDPELYYADPARMDTPPAGDWTPSKWGGFIPEVGFDPLRYGIPPSAIAAIEPVQLIALQVADQALADAGYHAQPFDRSTTGVVFAGAVGSDLGNAKTLRMVLPSYLGTLPPELDEQLPKLTEDSLPGRLGSVIAGRIANRLDLGGTNYTVDAACASSLAAVDAACKELASGTSDMMLCGGADLHNALEDFLLFASVGALSPTGRCKAFDASGDGIALSEGVSCIVLKRLADAEADGDRIYAVIKGVGGGSDGKALGLTAPRPAGQRRALGRAYRAAGISPAQVGLIEAHGTGTVVGDRTELETLTGVFTAAGAAPGGCVLGSVKSQIGHTKCAAGLAGLIKAAMSLYTGVLPPTQHLSEPNPAWRQGESPFAFHATAMPWRRRAGERIAGVSAFGFGGTNFHAVLAGHHSAAVTTAGLAHWPAELFCFHGDDDGTANRRIQQLLELAERNEANGRPWTLRDLAKTCDAGAARARTDDLPVRVAIVAGGHAELIGLLRAAAAGRDDPPNGLYRARPAEQCGKVAALFPGQGSQRPGMLAELFVAFPELHRIVHLRDAVGDAMFPPAAYGADAVAEQRQRLRDTTMAQPALGVTGLAVHHLLSKVGVRPDCYAGHSYGELVALAAAGAIGKQSLLELSAARADAILAAAGDDPGAMAAVSAAAEDVEQVIAGVGVAGEVVVANRNAPRQVVISGPTDQLDAVVAALTERRLAVHPLEVACAFHSPVVAGAGQRFAEALAVHPISAPDRPVWTNRAPAVYPDGPDEIRAGLVAQVVSPVRFSDQIEAMYAAGVRVFIEAGPGNVLGGLVGKVLTDRPHTMVGCDAPTGAGIRGLLDCLAQLAVAGISVRPGSLFAGRGARDVGSLDMPPRPRWRVNGQLVRGADGHPVPGGLAPARRCEVAIMSPPPAEPDREALLSDFLATSRELVAAQRDVMLSYLGAPDQPRIAASPPPRRLPAAVSTAPESEPLTEPQERAGAEQDDAEEDGADVLATVLEVIAARTGYPVEMIEPDLDLEADLSVDSIKRTEIAGELAARRGGRAEQVPLEELAKARTAAAMAGVLGGDAGDRRREPTAGTAAGDPTVEPATRYRLELVDSGDARPDEPTGLVGATIVVAGGSTTLADDVAGRLSAHGSVPVVVNGAGELPDDLEHVDGLVCLHPLDPDGPPALPHAYALFRTAVGRGAQRVLAVAAAGAPAPQAYGLRGFVRGLLREYPGRLVRLLELDATGATEAIAAEVVGELLTRDDEPVVVTAGGRRQHFRIVDAPLHARATTADGTALGLTTESVVLLIGGARGIAAQIANALAAASRCRIELAGRTPLPHEPEPAEVGQARDLPSLRAALARGSSPAGHGAPGEIDRMARRILAQREVSATLRELRAAGSAAGYRTVEALHPDSIRQLVKQVYAEHGRIDGVVYAAGVIADRLVVDKDPESFARVYRTKVDGAQAVLGELADLGVRARFVVLFGSIAATVGNKGQADYAAANDALEALGSGFARRGGRTLTVHWGPWAPDDEHGGMVTAELGRAYAERGIALLDPADGVACLLRELAWGPAEDTSVIYAATGWR